MDVVELIDQAGHVVQIPRARFAVPAGVEINEIGRCPAGTGVHPSATNVKILTGDLAVQHKILAAAINDIFNQGCREQQASIITERTTRSAHVRHHRGRSTG